MNDRELVAIFWATCAAVVAIWFLTGLVRLGLDQQERREKLDEITRLGQEIEADSPSLAAPDAADSPRQPTHHGPTAGETF